MESSITYPIAETFLSPQGEGQYAGTLMYFIRFAGCSVGKPFANISERNDWAMIRQEPIPQIYQEKCCTALGREFLCDTNFRSAGRETIPTLISQVGEVPRVCLTGGEPLMHNLAPLVSALWKAGKSIHIETSGTIQIPDYLLRPMGQTWIAVSPKAGCLQSSLMFSNEIKILVDAPFDLNEFHDLFNSFFERVWLQPVNHEHSINRDNLKLCLDLQRQYPQLRISTQMHKIWEVR